MSQDSVAVGPWRVSRATVRLCLFLLPVWTFGAAEFTRLVTANLNDGPIETRGLLKGRDFFQFYVAGTLAREQAWHELYDVHSLEREVARILPPAAGSIPAPVYGPQLAQIFAPLSRLPYLQARWWWLAISIVLYLAAAGVVIRTLAPLEGRRGLAWVTLLLNPAFAALLSTGQLGALGMIAWALAGAALAGGRRLLFGVWLGLLLYKPPLLVGVVPVLFILGMWPALAGIAMSGLAQVAISAAAAVIEPWHHYLGSIAGIRQYYYLTDTIPQHKQSFFGFFQLLTGSGGAAVAAGTLAACAVLALWWRHRHGQEPQRLVATLIPTSILLSPHFYMYDLVVLTPALLVVADRLSRRMECAREKAMAATAYAMLLAPYSGTLALHTHVQLATLVLAVLLISALGVQFRSVMPRRNAQSPTEVRLSPD